ncbi:MAG: hypothetical protein HOO15_00270 [Flavobacteriales bacterium]|nr:hypothetical protein [Flavobacteriales bacterium]
MKKLLFTLCVIIFLFSCSESAKDSESSKNIDIDKIETPCDLVDAFGIIADEFLELEKYDIDITDQDNIPDSVKKEMRDVMKKRGELMEKARELNFKESDIKDCRNFEEVDKK